ncbi:MAG: hypothetical protein M3Z75_06590 [Actinomycetota bacterium]|nr:hypothetical protein [Actinomycetota bacterium]
MPVPLFANKPERCPYGHSLARGKPQKIGWMPCICGPARERAARGHGGIGHLWVRCETCSAEDQRDTTFYEPPHDTGHQAASAWATRPGTLPNLGLIVGLRRYFLLQLRF